jgi:hypothetical protein
MKTAMVALVVRQIANLQHLHYSADLSMEFVIRLITVLELTLLVQVKLVTYIPNNFSGYFLLWTCMQK